MPVNPDNPDDFETWLVSNPYPSLDAMVRKHGRYDHIPAEAWGEYELAVTRWEAARRTRLTGSATWKLMAEEKWPTKKLR